MNLNYKLFCSVANATGILFFFNELFHWNKMKKYASDVKLK